MNDKSDGFFDDESEHSEDYVGAEELFAEFENGGFTFGQPEKMTLVPVATLESMGAYIKMLEQRLAFAQQDIQNAIVTLGRNAGFGHFSDKDRANLCADLADCLNRMARGWDKDGKPNTIKYDAPFDTGFKPESE